MRFETELVQFDAAPGDPYGPTVTPLYQTATFKRESFDEEPEYDYTRSGNPTRRVLEDHLARLEGGLRSATFASGMAALSAVTSLVKTGETILAGVDLYGGTYRLFTRVLEGLGIGVRYVDTTDLEAVREALDRDRPRLALIETPTNPLLRVTRIREVAALVHARGGLLAVDNSLPSPYLQRPLEHGADLVVHSATKYLSGHSDVTAGAVVWRDEELGKRVLFHQNAVGKALAPFEAWLLLRGVKTLALRVDRQQESAAKVASFLAVHPRVTRVHYLGLPTHPDRDAHFAQARGAGGVLGFETGSVELSTRLVESVRLFGITVSFGGVASSISLPARMSHASIPAEVRRSRHLPEDLVRVSIGIEHVDDLVADLAQALDAASVSVPCKTEVTSCPQPAW